MSIAVSWYRTVDYIVKDYARPTMMRLLWSKHRSMCRKLFIEGHFTEIAKRKRRVARLALQRRVRHP